MKHLKRLWNKILCKPEVGKTTTPFKKDGTVYLFTDSKGFRAVLEDIRKDVNIFGYDIRVDKNGEFVAYTLNVVTMGLLRYSFNEETIELLVTLFRWVTEDGYDVTYEEKEGHVLDTHIYTFRRPDGTHMLSIEYADMGSVAPYFFTFRHEDRVIENVCFSSPEYFSLVRFLNYLATVELSKVREKERVQKHNNAVEGFRALTAELKGK